MQHHHVGVLQLPETVGDRLEVVDQAHRSQANHPDEAAGVHDPCEICRGNMSVADRAGNGEAGVPERAPGLGQELFDDLLEARGLSAPKACGDDLPEVRAVRLEEPEPGIGPADVTREDHRRCSLGAG